MKKYWNFKAKKYPRPFENKGLMERKSIIKIIEKLGVDFRNKEIIDIGCGTGVYGLIFAKKAKHVLCLDFSNEMLKVLKDEAKKNSIENIKIVKKDFSKFDIGDYQKKFDISFASMTPAVKNSIDIVKMERLSRKWCVYIGWAGKRENRILNEVYSLFGLSHIFQRDILILRKYLTEEK
ncbi:MAG: class I SAM-dependent methyltransferase [Elusimicrobiota bacterium]